MYIRRPIVGETLVQLALIQILNVKHLQYLSFKHVKTFLVKIIMGSEEF